MTGDQQIQAMELAFPLLLKGARTTLCKPPESGILWSLEVRFGNRTVMIRLTETGCFNVWFLGDTIFSVRWCDEDPDESFDDDQGPVAFECAVKLLQGEAP